MKINSKWIKKGGASSLVVGYLPLIVTLVFQSLFNKYEDYTFIVWGGFIVIYVISIWLYIKAYFVKNANQYIQSIFSIVVLFLLYIGFFLHPLFVDNSDLSLMDVYLTIFIFCFIVLCVQFALIELNKNQILISAFQKDFAIPLEVKERVMDMIKEDKIMAAIEILEAFFRKNDMLDYLEDLTLLQNRIKRLEKMSLKNIITDSEAGVERAKIISSILNLF